MRTKPEVSSVNIRNDVGASSVEFAIILPVLVMILFGIFEFGLAYRDYLAITHAAREGARMAAIGEFSEAEVVARAYPVKPSSVSIAYYSADGTARHGAPVEVVVAYDRPLSIPLFATTNVHLASKARMRIEY
ncbi:MAG: pilus assembly protein [Actinomycetota bacterium]|nr:pilus assembly protein [Actinomycetota bacterium]